MEDFNSESDSDYTSYWRDWVGELFSFPFLSFHLNRLLPSLSLTSVDICFAAWHDQDHLNYQCLLDTLSLGYYRQNIVRPFTEA